MMTFTLTKKHLIGSILFSLFTGFSLAWWLVPNLGWMFASAAILILITSCILWFLNRDNATIKQQKNLEKQDGKLVKTMFSLFMTGLKDRGMIKRKYRLPWYLYITNDLKSDDAVLTQMGFRNNTNSAISEKLPVSIWLKNDAVVLTVEISDQDRRSLNCLKLLLKQAKKFRSRQTLNGIMISQSVDNLISNNKNNAQQITSDLRLVIDETQSLCGQKVPIYVLFNQMAGLSDFCQFFASLDEEQLNGNFGALNVKNANLGKFSISWFEKAYDNICKRMGQTILTALDSQLSEQFRRSVVAAPVQLKQIQPDISYFLEQLFTAKSYEFRGFFFTNTQQVSQATDPLTKQVAYQLGFNEMLQSDNVKLPHSIFISQLFDKIIRPEAGLAGININSKRLFWGFQISYSLAILTIVISAIALLKVNFDHYQPLNAKTLQQLKRYKNIVRKSPYDIEELAINVNNLQMIRNIYLEYNKPTPFYISDMIPNPQLSQSVKEAYHSELKDVLLPSLVHYLEDELFVYEMLGDSLQTAKLLNLNEELQLHDKKSWDHLKTYYKQSFIKEGHSEESTLKNLIVLMDDLHALGVPKVDLNQTLITQSKASINKINTTKVLFEYINDLPEFSSMVDISSELGNNFSDLYQFKTETQNQFIPVIYTPQGFAGMNLNADSDLIKNLIDNNKSLLGHSLNDFEIDNIAKSLQRYYQREYVQYWVDFIEGIELKSINNENLMHALSLMSSKTNAPQNRLYDAISYYTSPQIVMKKADKSEIEKKEQAVESLLKPVNEQVIMANNIKAEFSVYHRFVKKDDKGLSELIHLHDNITQVASWYKDIQDNKDIGAYLFEQLTSNKKDQSLYQLAQMQLSIPKIDLHISGIINTINQQVNTSVAGHVNKIWQKQISNPFNLQFANKFPFNLNSKNNVSFKLFNKYFKPEGVFDEFNSLMLNKFSQTDQGLVLNGFTLDSQLNIPSDINEKFNDLKIIQQTLYQENGNQASISFQLKTNSMSASLLNFELFSQRTLFNYEHGPKLWQSYVWPEFTTQNPLLTIFTDTQNKKVTKEYKSDWAWLRLVYKYYQTGNDNTQIKIVEDKSQVTLSLLVESENNPFEPHFFSKIKFPEKLL